MMITFEDARRQGVLLRMAVIGPPGSGKTLGALLVASEVGGDWYGIDTEHGRMKLYADRFKFKHAELPSALRTPEGYIEALREAGKAGAEGVIFDSASHEWLSILAEADKFSNWKELTPRHNEFVEALVSAPFHVIACMRSKIKYDVSEVEEGGRRRQVITRLGPGPVQREGIEYEFDVIAYLDENHEATFLNRCDPLVGKTMRLDQAAPIIKTWLHEGDPDPAAMRAPSDQIEALRKLRGQLGDSDEKVADVFARRAALSGGVLTVAWVGEKVAEAEKEIARRSEGAKAAKEQVAAEKEKEKA